jgi:solute carrier family 35
MAKSDGGGLLLPVSADGAKGNGGGGGAAGDTAVFKGSAMTRLGAAAALSYMVCSGTCCSPSAPSLVFWSYV